MATGPATRSSSAIVSWCGGQRPERRSSWDRWQHRWVGIGFRWKRGHDGWNLECVRRRHGVRRRHRVRRHQQRPRELRRVRARVRGLVRGWSVPAGPRWLLRGRRRLRDLRRVLPEHRRDLFGRVWGSRRQLGQWRSLVVRKQSERVRIRQQMRGCSGVEYQQLYLPLLLHRFVGPADPSSTRRRRCHGALPAPPSDAATAGATPWGGSARGGETLGKPDGRPRNWALLDAGVG